MSCGIDCVKWILFIFNFIWVLLGIAILAVGIFGTVSLEEAEGLRNVVATISICFIVLGVIIFVIAFFGCCGAVRESHCMVVTYAVFLLVILILQVAFGIWAFVQKDDSKTDGTKVLSNDEFSQSFNDYWSSKSQRDYIDQRQSSWLCCGIDGADDYNRFQNKTLPWSCCPHLESTANVNPCTRYNAFERGCRNVFLDLYHKVAKVVGGVSIGVAVSELLGIVFALCLANSIRNDHRRGYRV